MEDNRIIRDLRALTEDYLPGRLVHREGQLSALRDCLAPLAEGGKARPAFLWGPPGTGKTVLSRFAGEELRKEAPVQVAYLNCWESFTRHGILYGILSGMGVFVQRKGVPTDELVEGFRHKAKARRCLVILDEVDRLEEDEVLYDLLQADAGIILIANSETALYRADARIRSRLSAAEVVPFARYTPRELVDLLKDRREWGLVPGALKNEQLELIAELARGDARTALGILAAAAQQAERKDMERITDDLLQQAVPRALQDSRRKMLDALHAHQKLILTLLEGKGEQPAGELFERFLRQAGEAGDRTFRKHMDRLVRHGLVRSQGEGRWRTYALA